MSAREALRAVGLEALSLGATARGYPNLGKSRVHFLYLHSLERTRVATFVGLIDFLAESGDFVSYGRAVELMQEKNLSRPAYCVSTDDAFVSTLEVAELLERKGVSIGVFVPTGLVGADNRQRVAEFFRTDVGIEDKALTWSDLENLKERGHDIGSHTVNHPNLALLSPDELSYELGESRAELVKRLGECSHFAWPYGRAMHFSSEAYRAVVSAGYGSLASAVRGSHSGGGQSGLTVIRRDHVDPSWPVRHSKMFVDRSAAALRPAVAWSAQEWSG